MGKVDFTYECHLFISTRHCMFQKGVSGGCFVLVNKCHYPQTTFTHNLGPMFIIHSIDH